MFNADELEYVLFEGLDWELVDESFDITPPDVEPVPFQEAHAEVHAHVAEHGAIYFETFRWSSYPHIVLQEGDRIWTSLHVALRKPQ